VVVGGEWRVASGESSGAACSRAACGGNAVEGFGWTSGAMGVAEARGCSDSTARAAGRAAGRSDGGSLVGLWCETTGLGSDWY
jgi:hypothetical protein